MVAKLVPRLEVAPPASGNIAGVDRGVGPGTLAEEAGTVAEQRADELVIVSQLEAEIESTVAMQGHGLVTVWKMQGGLSAKSDVEETIEAYFVAAGGSEKDGRGKADAVEVYHT